jgi:hypothetical protein
VERVIYSFMDLHQITIEYNIILKILNFTVSELDIGKIQMLQMTLNYIIKI